MSYTRLPYEMNTAGLATFVVDTVSDIASLPTGNTPGSRAIVVNTGAEYMLNNQHEWKKQSSSSGGGSGSGGDNMTEDEVQALIDESLSSLTSQITAQESTISAQAQTISSLQQTISSLSSTVDTQQGTIDGLTSSLSTEQSTNQAQATSITNLENDISSLETAFENQGQSYDPSQAGYILAIDSNGDVVPVEVSAASGLITTTTSGQTTYEVESYTGRGSDNEYLYECTAQAWQSFSVQDGESVRFSWNRLSYTVYVTQVDNDFVLGDPAGNDPYVIMTHRQDLGLNKLIAKVYNPSEGYVRDYTLKITTGIPQTTDNLTLRANGSSYRLYIDNNDTLQIRKIV